MERGIYFDGWYKNNHCYHPGLPIRSMQMIEDLEKYRGTILVWSALGGGSISLPYLEHEAYGKVDPRLRFYGFMNDSEFIEECNKRDIKVFGIVFEVQGWEFPAVFSEDGTELLGLNVLRDDKDHDWYGLREFTSGKHDKVFGKSLKDYFPEGLYNSDNEEVKDIWEECAARTYTGEAVHSNWVEVVNHKHIAYQMCRNNPVWRQYLKKIMEIQIDAGVPGIQLDECELPITALQAGGCFCNDCKKQFREYLKGLKANGKLDPKYNDIDLNTFDYQAYLNERDLKFPKDPKGVPLFREYWEFQIRAVKKYFTELVDHAKEYGLRTKDKEILVSGNFFNLMPVYYPIESKVDVIITEMRQTVFKQPHWYRYSAGFAGEKTIVVAENPYGGIVPDLVEMLETGNGYDLYKLFLLEASVYGCNMAVPYGGWMGNTIKDSFTPPRAVTEEVQKFLADNERLFSKKSGTNVAVLYSFPSYYWRETATGYSGNLVDNNESGLLSYKVDDINNPNTPRLPFWEVIKHLSDKQVNYDVRMSADDDLRVDDFSMDHIKDYELIVLPDCDVLTENQTKVLEEFVSRGSKLVIFGRAAENVAGWLEKMKAMDNVFYCENPTFKTEALENFGKCFDEVYSDVWQVKTNNPEIGIQTHKTEDGMAVHLVNYNYSKEKDKIDAIEELQLNVRTKEVYKDIKVHTLDGSKVEYSFETKGEHTAIKLYNLPVYAVVDLIS
jgi:hypothetical protein